MPANFPAKVTELMNEARDPESAYEPLGPMGVPNWRSKAGILCTPAKLVVSKPKSVLRSAVMKQALNSAGVIFFNMPLRLLLRGETSCSMVEAVISKSTGESRRVRRGRRTGSRKQRIDIRGVADSSTQDNLVAFVTCHDTERRS